MRHRKLIAAALVLLALLALLSGALVSAQGAPFDDPPTGTVLRGGAYVLAPRPGAAACELDGVTAAAARSDRPAVAAGGAYVLAPAAPADSSGCCCRGYLPVVRR